MFSLLYVFGTCGYTIVQFFCYTGATHKKNSYTVATQLYAKKRLIYASYTLQPKEIRANCGLAVNPYVSLPDKLYIQKPQESAIKHTFI